MSKKKVWVAVIGLSDDKTGESYEPGDPVPDSLLKRVPEWVERGYVEQVEE